MVGTHLFLTSELSAIFTRITVFIRTARCLLCKSHSATRCSFAIGTGKLAWITKSHTLMNASTCSKKEKRKKQSSD